MSSYLKVGVIGKSLKENEKRVPIHPKHINRIDKNLRKNITFEEGYGSNFGVDDSVLAELTSGKVVTRKQIMNNYDCVLMPKPLAEDLSSVKEGTIVWGWPHCVQQKEITQISIDRKLTLIAWESMFNWSDTGEQNMHIFYKNNELAGYAGVNHALSLIGVAGNYGKALKAVVLSFGSVSRGAVYALQGQGFQDITVYTNRLSTDVSVQLPSISFKQIMFDDFGKLLAIEPDGRQHPFSEVLADAHIIVNGMFQDTNNPMMFVSEEESGNLMDGTLIVDISCDKGMGFWCARPTTFDDPMFEVNGKFYYSVDHSPSFYWDSASWEISEALLPFLPIVMGGSKAWKGNNTISNAIEIRKGIIQNSDILLFQNREKNYPHLLQKVKKDEVFSDFSLHDIKN